MELVRIVPVVKGVSRKFNVRDVTSERVTFFSSYVTKDLVNKPAPSGSTEWFH